MFKSNFEYKQHAGPTKVSALGSNCSLVLKPEKKYCSIFIKKKCYFIRCQRVERNFPKSRSIKLIIVTNNMLNVNSEKNTGISHFKTQNFRYMKI